MLGIRHYNDLAIDIYQGDIGCFASDALVFGVNQQLRADYPDSDEVLRIGGIYPFAQEKRSQSQIRENDLISLPSGKLATSRVYLAIKYDESFSSYGSSGNIWLSILKLSSHHRHIAVAIGSFASGDEDLKKASSDFLNALKQHHLFLSKLLSQKARITLCVVNKAEHETVMQILDQCLPDNTESP